MERWGPWLALPSSRVQCLGLSITGSGVSMATVPSGVRCLSIPYSPCDRPPVVLESQP